eukprot:363565-Chlamydomonas_euryale.AAC.15
MFAPSGVGKGSNSDKINNRNENENCNSKNNNSNTTTTNMSCRSLGHLRPPHAGNARLCACIATPLPLHPPKALVSGGQYEEAADALRVGVKGGGEAGAVSVDVWTCMSGVATSVHQRGWDTQPGPAVSISG